MRANAGDFDHRALRRKRRRAAGGLERFRGGAARRLADRSAVLADKEDHGVATRMTVHTRDESIAAFDPMNKTVVPQEFERAINGDWRRPAPIGQPLDDLVGTERPVACEQRFEHVPAHGSQPLHTRGAKRFRMRDGGAGTAAVIVVRRWENQVRRHCHLGATEAVQILPIVAAWAASRKRDTTPNLDIALQQKPSHIAAAQRNKFHIATRIPLRRACLNWG
jgi:hypothetical protein